ncbi:MAG: hypothetical protein JSV91_11980 [Phycisphaerales bacterium]|nr:MAG: hypothetical protein JSV91_11980 [Phycisphaerales bacterium]
MRSAAAYGNTIVMAVICLGLCVFAAADDLSADPPPKTQSAEEPAAAKPARTSIQILLEEIDRLQTEIRELRQVLAEAQLASETYQRQFEELEQFILDHHEYGEDFQQYKGVKAVAEREARRRDAEENRRQREIEKAERQARQAAARAEYDQRRAEMQRAARYRKSGFTSLGLDVFSGKMAYFYRTKDVTRSRIDYEPGMGNYLRLYPNAQEIDFSSMTISGSVLNGADEIRNIGVAITFFDNNGNQVGHEIVQIKNARPDVPYPFTSTIEMALNRPFESSSVYVLYADQVPVEEYE